jgi:hypothetical protein
MLHVLIPSSTKDEDVIHIYHYKELVKGLNTSSINLMKVAGAFVYPKGMTNHLKRPSLDLKVVFHTLVGSMGAWWYM